MRKLITGFITLLLLLIVAALVVPFLIPASQYKTQILALVEAKTGRKVTADGDIYFTLLPDIALKAEQVTVANPEHFSSPYFAKVPKLSLNLALWPLLEKRIIIKALEVEKPVLFLEQNAIGKRNWELAGAAAASATGAKAPAAAATANSEAGAAKAFVLDIGRVTIQNADVTYRTQDSTMQVTPINARFTQEELVFDAVVAVSGKQYTVEVNADTPSQLWAGKALPVQLRVRGEPLDFHAEGEVSGVDMAKSQFKPQYRGNLMLSVPSIGALQQSFTGKRSLPDLPLMLESQQATLDASRIALSTLQLGIENVAAIDGQVTLDYAAKKPSVKANLSMPVLDIQPLLAESGAQGKKLSQLLELLVSPAYAAAPDEGWSREPIDLSALTMANAVAEVKIGSLQSDSFVARDVALSTKLLNGVLNAKSNDFELAGGKVRVVAEVNANSMAAGWRKEVVLKDVYFEQLAEFFTDASRLEGPMSGQMMFSANGKSMYDWMQTLSGGGDATISKGVIRGYSLPKLFRNVKTAFAPAALRAAQAGVTEEDTQFSKLALHFTADKGVLTIKEGQLQAPLLQASATGKVSLKDKTLDLYLKPVIVPSLSSESGPNAGLMVPLTVKGPFANLSIAPDLKAAVTEIIENPEKLKDAAAVVREEGRAIREGFQEQKKSLKDSFKLLKENKDAGSLGNFLNQLDPNRASVPDSLPDGEDTTGSTGSGDGAGTQP